MEPLHLLEHQQKGFLSEITGGPPCSSPVSQGSNAARKLKLELHKVQWDIMDVITHKNKNRLDSL